MEAAPLSTVGRAVGGCSFFNCLIANVMAFIHSSRKDFEVAYSVKLRFVVIKSKSRLKILLSLLVVVELGIGIRSGNRTSV